MKYNLKKFVNKNIRYERRITVRGTNSIGLPTAFFKENGIEKFKYAVLYFDTDSKAVGVHFTNDEDEKGKFSLIKSKRGYGAGIMARSFFQAHNIDAKAYKGRYEWEKHELDDVGAVFVFELKERVKDKVQKNIKSPI